MTKTKFKWDTWLTLGGSEPTSEDILALLNSRDAAVKTLLAIKAECPTRPTKPIMKRICELVNTGIKEAQSGN